MLAIPPDAFLFMGRYLSALISGACFFLPVRALRISSIMLYKRFAPASVDPLPKCDTTSAGTTNSPSARRAGCFPPITPGMESDIPSPGPFNILPPSE